MTLLHAHGAGSGQPGDERGDTAEERGRPAAQAGGEGGKEANPSAQEEGAEEVPYGREAAEWLSQTLGEITEGDLQATAARIQEAMDKALKAPFVETTLARLMVMLMMLRDYALTRRYPHVPWRTLSTLAAVVIYLLNPLDLVPDVLPGVGYLDDAAVIAVAWKLVRDDMLRYAEWKLEHASCTAGEREQILVAFEELGSERQT